MRSFDIPETLTEKSQSSIAIFSQSERLKILIFINFKSFDPVLESRVIGEYLLFYVLFSIKVGY